MLELSSESDKKKECLGLLLLIWASFFGYIGKGSRRWISFSGFNFQPSELMKILIIVILAKYFAVIRQFFGSFTEPLNGVGDK